MITSDDILKEFERMNNTPSGEQHTKRHWAFQRLVRFNQDALLELVFSGKIQSDPDLLQLITFGGDTGNAGRQGNEHWIPFMRRVWERKDKLPESVRGAVEWYAAQWGITE